MGRPKAKAIDPADLPDFDAEDAPFEFDKDHYFVLRQPDTDEYRLHGPFRKGEPDH